MFGLVLQRTYNKLDKKYVLLQQEMYNLKKNNVIIKQNEMDNLMSNMKELELQNIKLRDQLGYYIRTFNKINHIIANMPYEEPVTAEVEEKTAVWIKKEGMPYICSNCGYSFWNGTDNYMLHCSGCGRRMERIVTEKSEEK